VYPVLFDLGPWPVQTYYLFWSLALTLAVLWTRKRAAGFYGLDDDFVRKLMAITMTGMFIGARAGWILDASPVMRQGKTLAELLLFGGLSAAGGFWGGGLGALVFFYRKRKWGLIAPFAESAALPAALLIVVGRIGCFMNGCCLGRPTDLPWGVLFPEVVPAVARHPVQLYYSGWCALVLAFLFCIEHRSFLWKRASGARSAVLMPLFIFLYSGGRLVLDSFRAGGPSEVGLSDTLLFTGGLALGFGWLCLSAFATLRRSNV